MVINVDQRNYVSESGDIAGVRVIVLPRNQIAFPEDEGITVSTGHSTFVGVTQVENFVVRK